MIEVGQKEAATQARVLQLFIDHLGYAPLGNLKHGDNHNVDEHLLRDFLEGVQEYSPTLANRAIEAFHKVADDTSLTLYDRNKAVYGLLRYGVKVTPDVGEQTETVWLIDWAEPLRNHFAVAEEVTVKGKAGGNPKRPDVVLYVNGIALVTLELKRSSVSVSEGIRQNLDNQKKDFIEHYFSTMQLVLAGNDTEGLRYGTVGTPEKYYLTWKEAHAEPLHALDQALVDLCRRERLIELIHDFVVFDAGVKKLCRHHQYFGVRAAQAKVLKREGGIIWHTQGSGKSLTMVWLARWIREHVTDARVLIVTDRSELDQQIEGVFKGVKETIYRTESGADLMATLNASEEWLICSLIHKFGAKSEAGALAAWVDELKKGLPPGFSAKGDLYVFVDECHRSQAGDMHKAMKALLPNAVFIGFTGTPILQADKQQSIELFGGYIHTYKFDEAVRDEVVRDLRYEARDVPQDLKSPKKVDEWFEAATKGLTDLAKAQLKQYWGTLKQVLSSKTRLEVIMADIMLDMKKLDRLASGKGNAMLVAGSIYEACRYYELFAATELAGKCAIVTSYEPTAASIKGEETGEGKTRAQLQYSIYRKMLAAWFNEPEDTAANRVEEFEKAVKKKFIEEPGQMKLLIVVDKLLTGFDAPPCTYLYIDKHMQDHGLFQAICRVNRLDGDDKEFGYVFDYKDLFKHLEGAVKDYTSEVLKGYDKADVQGLLKDRLEQARKRLEEVLESLRALCEPGGAAKDLNAQMAYFSSKTGDVAELKEREPRRLALYKLTASLVRAWADIAGEMAEAGYSAGKAELIKEEVKHFEALRNEVKKHSGDAIDLKQYEPAMRHLIDTYIKAGDSEVLSTFENKTLVQLIVQQGTAAAIQALPERIQASEKAVSETIENNVRKLILDETPINPKYYDKMSKLLDTLIQQRLAAVISYQAYLAKIASVAAQVQEGPPKSAYPEKIDNPARRALYDQLSSNEALALSVDHAVRHAIQDDWRNHTLRTRKVFLAIKALLQGDEALTASILNLVKSQHDY
jgi:type I restriction enzyme R subunit